MHLSQIHIHCSAKDTSEVVLVKVNPSAFEPYTHALFCYRAEVVLVKVYPGVFEPYTHALFCYRTEVVLVKVYPSEFEPYTRVYFYKKHPPKPL